MNDSLPWILLGSLLWGAALGTLAEMLLAIATQPRRVDPELGRFEEARRARLRAKSWTYRVFEPWVDELAAATGAGPDARQRRVAGYLAGSGDAAPWKPAEFCAVALIESGVAAAVAALFGGILGGKMLAFVFALPTFFLYRSSYLAALKKQYQRRAKAIKRALAGAVDLLALMMEVGGGFQEGLTTVARRMAGSPLGEELQRVLNDIGAGRPQKEALRDMAERVADDDVSELVFAVVQGQELGTPLAAIFRNQADQMRQKRSLWAERAAAEAQVTIVFPAMVIMLACLIIVAAPFILVALHR
jgi:tight adherence protein C